jgi:hypothetical protein
VLRVSYGRLATGLVFLALFVGLELRIAALQSLIPGSYAGLTSGNYLGFVFLISALGAIGGAFHSVPDYAAGGSQAAGSVDPRALAAAMQAMQQSGGGARTASSGTVPCPACGASNLAGAKFCQACGRTFPAAPGS